MDKTIISHCQSNVHIFVGKKSIRDTYAVIEFNRDCLILNDQIECNSRNKFEEPFCDTVTTISQFVQNVHTFVESSAKKKQTSDRYQRLSEMKNHIVIISYLSTKVNSLNKKKTALI